ncbi:hypothetical protein ARALYDRAFT_893712 [Arabidopsis lyrata subsp. lyrata]|uniref:B box-type domain-containing protein n=1 Tax=Arabidopsis lyrata subsp. lyrata TaxID=81972 RepID=D7KYB6_ARALL|nr:hypothetical protein ARALYDRAFT_893712 [Arabidopsis lyrata subsp. lyrata]
MAHMCHSCRRRTAAIHCFTENTNVCLTCDYMLHFHVGILGHLRYQLCDNCMVNPASLVCSIHMIILCLSCYVLHYNCVTFGHHIQPINNFPERVQFLENPQHYHGHEHDHEHHVGDYQRREGMFQMSCNGNNDCERWMFALECESCIASNAVVYCAQEDFFLCDNCDRVMHNHEVIPPHMRCKLCETCKRLSRNFLIGAYHFSLPPTPLAVAAEEVSALQSSGPSQYDEMDSSVNQGEGPSRVRFMLSRLSLRD